MYGCEVRVGVTGGGLSVKRVRGVRIGSGLGWVWETAESLMLSPRTLE